ncbi:MAG: hypothetical protein F6K08_35230 [Okeania sp. SIO1H6]|nr:hypothetical protein [Okeania sp. SIO1H6]
MSNFLTIAYREIVVSFYEAQMRGVVVVDFLTIAYGEIVVSFPEALGVMVE